MNEEQDEDGLRPRSEWSFSDYAVEAICKTIGCGSVISRWQGFGYRFVCNPLCLWFFDREERREARQGGVS